MRKKKEMELRKLKREELVKILLEQSREIDSLREELAETKKQLESRKIQIEEAGSLAEAAISITKVLEAAQEAADLYLENIRGGTGNDSV